MSKRHAWSLIVVASLGLVGVGTLAASQAQAAPALVKTAPGRILVNARGMTLYLYTPDKPNKSVCTGACAKAWPPLLVSKGMKVPATMAGISGKFGVAMRAGGARQLTYDGAPLYTWIKDKKPGDMTGQGVGGVWWTVVVGAAGSGMAPASAPIKTASARILVNARGMTLYLFSPDKPNKSVCTGDCAKAWPPLLVPKGMKVPATMAGISGKFGVAMRAGGVRQLTYDGAPLYTWFKDKKSGDMTGQGVGGVCWVVTVGAPQASSSGGSRY